MLKWTIIVFIYIYSCSTHNMFIAVLGLKLCPSFSFSVLFLISHPGGQGPYITLFISSHFTYHNIPSSTRLVTMFYFRSHPRGWAWMLVTGTSTTMTTLAPIIQWPSYLVPKCLIMNARTLIPRQATMILIITTHHILFFIIYMVHNGIKYLMYNWPIMRL